MNTYRLDELIAAIPGASHEAMQAALPDRYSPELADEFAAHMIAELERRRPVIEQGVTA
ncbi:hypothetical protein ACYF6T_21210 [Streptomyces sp. 7R007]